VNQDDNLVLDYMNINQPRTFHKVYISKIYLEGRQ